MRNSAKLVKTSADVGEQEGLGDLYHAAADPSFTTLVVTCAWQKGHSTSMGFRPSRSFPRLAAGCCFVSGPNSMTTIFS